MTNGRGGTFHPVPFRPPDIRTEKSVLRERMRAVRSELHRPERDEALCSRIIADLPIAHAIVAGFWPIATEPDVRPVLRHVVSAGGTAALPSSGPPGTPLVFRAWDPEQELVVGRFGIAEPKPEQPPVIPDFVLVPFLAFDPDGFRVGYGAGYYDRTLAGLRRRGPVVAVGVGYAGQELAEVPRDRHDQKLDWIITERDSFRFASKG